MGFKDILIHVDSTPASAMRLRLGLTLAQRFGARLSGMHIIPKPDVPPYFKPSAAEKIAAIYQESALEAAILTEEHFREAVKDCGLVTAWQMREGDLAQSLAEQARFADLLLLGQYDTENPPTISAFLLPEKVVIKAGTPILIVPADGRFDDVGQHIMAAWDGSREAARALHDAMPFLQAADKVSLLAVDPNRKSHMHAGANVTEMAAHLSRHGIRAEPMEVASGGKHVPEVLLAHIADLQADLLVMGAYGHPRLLEFVLGGTTQDLLTQVSIPVLMSH